MDAQALLAFTFNRHRIWNRTYLGELLSSTGLLTLYSFVLKIFVINFSSIIVVWQSSVSGLICYTVANVIGEVLADRIYVIILHNVDTYELFLTI